MESLAGDGHYSPLATPTRSSLKRQGVPGTPNSVRFFGITYDDVEDEHTEGVGPFRGRNPMAIKQAIFKKYFNEFVTYPLLQGNAPARSIRGSSRATRSVHSAPITNSGRQGAYNTPDSPWGRLSSTHVPSEWESPWPRWAVGRDQQAKDGVEAQSKDSSSPFFAASRPVTTDGNLSSHLAAFDALLAQKLTKKEVEHAQVRGFFRRLVPHLGAERLQGPTALLLAACARVHPPILLPLAQPVCGALPLLIQSSHSDVRQAALCLLGLLWRAAAASAPSQQQADILATPKLLEALVGRVASGDYDALWAARELTAGTGGAIAMERCGAVRALCRALKRAVKAAKATAKDKEAEEDGEEEYDAQEAGSNDGGTASGTLRSSNRAGSGGKASGAGTKWPGAAAAGKESDLAKGAAARVGITDGGSEVDRIAQCILIVESLTGFTSVLSASITMCKRHKVPERLVYLLLATSAAPDPEEEKEKSAESGAGSEDEAVGSSTAAATGSKAGSADGSGSGEKSGSGSDRVPKLSLPGVATAEGEDELTADDSAKSSRSGKSSKSSKSSSSTKNSVSGSTSTSTSTSTSSSTSTSTGTSTGTSTSTSTSSNSSGSSKSSKRSSSSSRGSSGLGTLHKCRLQLQESVLRCLYALASCGHGREPQEAVQQALREEGESVVQRLAAVLQAHCRLEGCTAASYLLWLMASGDFSPYEASELNVFRSRMGAEAPPPEDDSGDRGGGSSGYGVVPAISELLLTHLTNWKDVSLGDCVPAVRTTVPPPPPPPPARPSMPQVAVLPVPSVIGDPAAAVPAVREGYPQGPAVLSGSGTLLYGSGAVMGSTGDQWVMQQGRSVGGGASAHFAPSEVGRWVSSGVAGAGSSSVLRSGSQPGEAEGPGSEPGMTGLHDNDRTVLRGLPQLRVLGASAVLLTPREGQLGPTSMVSPQRYSNNSSDDEGTGDGGALRPSGSSARPADASGGTADQLSNTQDLDLSNVIDSSVELTGKEQIMRLIKEAGATIMEGKEPPQEDEQAAAEAASADGAPADAPADEPAAGGDSPSGNGIEVGPANDVNTPAIATCEGQPTPAAAVGRVPAVAPPSTSLTGHLGDGAAEAAAATAAAVAMPSAADGGTALVESAPATAVIAPPGQQGFPPYDASQGPPYGTPPQVTEGNPLLGYGTPAYAPGYYPAGAAPGNGHPMPPTSEAHYCTMRPSALVLPTTATASPPAKSRRPKPVVLPSLASWLGAVRHVRGGRSRAGIGLGGYSNRGPCGRPAPANLQVLLAHCVGLLGSVALSEGGCRAVCAREELLPYITLLLDVPVDVADTAAAVAVQYSGLDLRLQLLALLSNVSMHPEGAAAIASAQSSGAAGLSDLATRGDVPTLAEVLYGIAWRACQMIRRSPTSWQTGQRLLEPCFTVLTNIHRTPSVSLSIPADPLTNAPRDAFTLAVEALSVDLPAAMGLPERNRLRAAAARMLDSAVAAYEGVGRDVPERAVSELILLLGGGRYVPPVSGADERGGSRGGATAAAAAPAAFLRDETSERVAGDAAAALWQLMAGGMLHPEAVATALVPPVCAILRSGQRSSPELRRMTLGLVSCLARSPLLARRLWTSPVVPAVLRTQELAMQWVSVDEKEWRPVAEVAREVCQQLCRACHREDRGSVSNTDKRVDRWGLAERMLKQLKCQLEFDYDEEAIMLVPLEEN